jgi:excisionase family DNA binding protein
MEAMPRPRPPHLHRQVTQHSKTVWYVRIGKGPRIRIRSAFGTPEFDAEYRAAIMIQACSDAPRSPLLTVREAADTLGISVKTLRGHIRNGRVRYVNVGLGEFRPRYRFEESDLIEFKEANRRRNAEAISCRSIARKAPRSTTSISSGEVIAFTDQRRQRTSEKLKRQNG